MRFFAFIATLVTALTVHAASPLKNCAADGAVFFAHDLEEIAQEGKTPVLLFNDSNEVVGLIIVSPERAKLDPYQATVVNVEKVSLCSSLEVSDFYYTDGVDQNLLQWASTGTVTVSQDEGQILIEAKVAKKQPYATRVDVSFKAYDVMTEIEEYTPAQRKDPNFDKEWGLPKGIGTFHFYVPANWKLAK